jgi:hypothetical protein
MSLPLAPGTLDDDDFASELLQGNLVLPHDRPHSVLVSGFLSQEDRHVVLDVSDYAKVDAAHVLLESFGVAGLSRFSIAGYWPAAS